jgi:hypothetical protein
MTTSTTLFYFLLASMPAHTRTRKLYPCTLEMSDYCLMMMMVWGTIEEEALLCWCLERLGKHQLELQNQVHL